MLITPVEVDELDARVEGVGDHQIVARVDGDRLGPVQLGGGRGAAIAGRAGRAVPGHRVDVIRDGFRQPVRTAARAVGSRHQLHIVGASVGDQQVASAVQRDPAELP